LPEAICLAPALQAHALINTLASSMVSPQNICLAMWSWSISLEDNLLLETAQWI
jgi:hypothetical protein